MRSFRRRRQGPIGRFLRGLGLFLLTALLTMVGMVGITYGLNTIVESPLVGVLVVAVSLVVFRAAGHSFMRIFR